MRGLLLVLVAVVSFVYSAAYTLPYRNGMLVYQVPGYYNSQLRNQAYQTMLVHYSQNPYAGRGVGEAGTSAFASGDTIAAGSLLKGSKVQRQEQESSYENSDTVSIAEAYPEEPPASLPFNTAGIPQRQAEPSNEIVPPFNEVRPEQPPILNQNSPEFVPTQPPFAYTTQSNSVEQTTAAEAFPPFTTLPPFPTLPPPTTTTTTTSKPNKKKVRVDLDIPSDDDDDDDEDEDYIPFLKPKKNKSSQYPPYSFFPVNFGRTAGGAIAVANSTGKGGARSHAIAYGSPSTRQKGLKRLTDE